MMRRIMTLSAIAGMLAILAATPPAVGMDWVIVGDEGNAGDTSWDAGDWGGELGEVAVEYQIGKYEVTNDQYVEFLNGVAASDPHGLYNDDMGLNARGGIERTGDDGAYAYAAKTNMGDKPVNYVSYFDSLRFANWMHNGKGTGDTEDGAYDMTSPLGADTPRKASATVWLANEDEWWKAAYYDPDADTNGDGTGDGPYYWDNALQSNLTQSVPTVTADVDGNGIAAADGISANWGSDADWNGQDGNVTTVGTNGGSSHYGTYDQNGNVWEWLQGSPGWATHLKGILCGSWDWSNGAGSSFLQPFIEADNPTAENASIGFRLAGVVVSELVWDGGEGSWFATDKWNGGGVSANMDMIIDAANTGGTPTGPSAVTVDADFVDGGDGPAKSVTLGAIGDATNDAQLKIDVGVTLEVTGATTVAEFGKVISSVQGNDTDATAECGVIETEDLAIHDADSIQVDWTEGSDATSMFGGVYTISEYTGTPLADFGESANAAGNIGGAYIKNTEYAVDINGDGSVYAVEIELHGQGVGDTDLDGVVGPADLADFGLGWSPNASDKTWAEGDFDFNGNVDPADLAAFGLAWAPNGIAFPSDTSMGVVPEPGTALMLLIGLAGLLIYRKRR